MKKFYLLFGLILLFSVVNLQSQNDTLYVMRAGIIINKQSIKTEDVDSLIFHKPAVYIEQTLYGDTLSEEDNLFLESISVPNPDLNEMIDPNGNIIGTGKSTNTKAAIANNLLTKMLSDAQSLSGQKILSHPEEGLNKPQHFGLVYSYGQRNITQRLAPPSKEANHIHRKYSVFGTDCSGFLINLLRFQGINIRLETTVETFESNLKAALSNNPSYKDFVVENKGTLPINEIKSGDFIRWFHPSPTPKNPKNWTHHIGIVTELQNSTKIVFQSNGTGTPEDEASQTKNLSQKRGVHPFSLYLCLNGIKEWGANYQIIRIIDTTDYSALSGFYTGTGTWTNYQGNGDASFLFTLSFVVDDNGILSGNMGIDNYIQAMTGTTNGTNISFEWVSPPAAPFKYSGTFSANKKTIEGSGGAGNYYSPDNANGPFKITKQ